MSVLAWIGLGLGLWFVLAVVAGLIVGQAIRLADRGGPGACQ